MTTPQDRYADDAGENGELPTGDEQLHLSGCEFFASVAAELALGSLTGADRSVALAHLDGCEDCGALIKELASAVDALLLVAPEADPPAGFEVRWLARITPESARTGAAPTPAASTSVAGASVIPFRRRARAVFAAAAAAIVVAGAGVGLGVAVAPKGHSGPITSNIRLAALRSVAPYATAGATVGEAAIIGGPHSWVLMTFQKAGWSGEVECVVTANGQSRDAGTFLMQGGTGSWAVPLSTPGASVTSAEVRSTTGAILATATFAT